jgi:hypothetical protein
LRDSSSRLLHRLIHWRPRAGRPPPPPHTSWQVTFTTADPANLTQVTALAAASDVVIMAIGEAPESETPGSTDDLTMSASQLALFAAINATATPLVTILVEPRPRILGAIADGSAALVMAYLPCVHGGQAIAEMLTGALNPSGKLPITYPRSTGDLDVYYHKPWNGSFEAPAPHAARGVGMGVEVPQSLYHGECFCRRRLLCCTCVCTRRCRYRRRPPNCTCVCAAAAAAAAPVRAPPSRLLPCARCCCTCARNAAAAYRAAPACAPAAAATAAVPHTAPACVPPLLLLHLCVCRWCTCVRAAAATPVRVSPAAPCARRRCRRRLLCCTRARTAGASVRVPPQRLLLCTCPAAAAPATLPIFAMLASATQLCPNPNLPCWLPRSTTRAVVAVRPSHHRHAAHTKHTRNSAPHLLSPTPLPPHTPMARRPAV